MNDESDDVESGATLTLPRPRDRASQTDFLRDLSRARRAIISNPAPLAPPRVAPESHPAPPSSAVSLVAPETNPSAFSAAQWFESTSDDTAENEAPVLGLFDILPLTTWPEIIAPDDEATNRTDGLDDERAWNEDAAGGLFDVLPPTMWPRVVGPETESTEAGQLDGLFVGDPWGEADPSIAPIEEGPAESSEGRAASLAEPEECADPASLPVVSPATVSLDATSFTQGTRVPVITATTPVIVRCSGLVASRLARGKRHTVLSGADLTVRAGEVVVVTGRSGSGKTTLLECLNGLHRIDAGTVMLGETSVGDATDAEIAELRATSIGYIAQEPHLLADLTAIENIELPLLLSGWDPAEARSEAEAAVSLVRLQHPTYRSSELSSGERRRVAIARALVGEPSILWSDEMSAGIDPETVAEIYELLFELCHDGLAVVAVTHDPMMLANATTTYVLRDGTLHVVDR